MKIQKKIGGEGGRVGGGGQGGCERRIEVFVKIQKKKKLGGSRGGVRWRGRVEGGQGGCERRIEVFWKIQKKNNFFLGGGVGGGLGLGWGVGLGDQGGCE